MTDDDVRILSRPPGRVTGLVRAALPSVPVVNRLPGVRKRGGEPRRPALGRRGVLVRPTAVAAYGDVCGFSVTDPVPPTYPHVLAFPLHAALISSADFPWPALGLVHLENAITAHRAIRPGERLDLTARLGIPRPHPKGAVVDVATEVRVGDEPVWEATSSYLRRGPGPDHTHGADTGLGLTEAPTGTEQWRLRADLGRRYAAVSGDYNPIHLAPLTARALGFPRQIAHGMWSLARCVAELRPRLPEAVRVEAAFRRPVLLPGTVAFGLTARDDGDRFALTRPGDGAPHLLGRTITAD